MMKRTVLRSLFGFFVAIAAIAVAWLAWANRNPDLDQPSAPPADPKLKVPPQPKKSDPKSAGNNAAIQRTSYNGSRPRATSAKNVPALGELDDYQGGAIAPRTSR